MGAVMEKPREGVRKKKGSRVKKEQRKWKKEKRSYQKKTQRCGGKEEGRRRVKALDDEEGGGTSKTINPWWSHPLGPPNCSQTSQPPQLPVVCVYRTVLTFLSPFCQQCITGAKEHSAYIKICKIQDKSKFEGKNEFKRASEISSKKY